MKKKICVELEDMLWIGLIEVMNTGWQALYGNKPDYELLTNPSLVRLREVIDKITSEALKEEEVTRAEREKIEEKKKRGRPKKKEEGTEQIDKMEDVEVEEGTEGEKVFDEVIE